jgi:hypothetical protein
MDVAQHVYKRLHAKARTAKLRHSNNLQGSYGDGDVGRVQGSGHEALAHIC